MSEPERGGIGERVNEAINWLQSRSRNEWIMFGIGLVIGLIIS